MVRIYRLVWLLTCILLAGAGLLTGLMRSPTAMGGVGVAAFIVGAVVAFAVLSDTEPDSDSNRAAVVLRSAALTSLITPAAIGLAVVLGGEFVLVALCMVLSSPQLVVRYYRWLKSAPKPSAGQFGAAMTAAAWASPGYIPVGPGVPSGTARPVAPLRALTDEELCQRWQLNCAALSEQRTPIARIGDVEGRRELLEEIERRNPAGFLRWMTSEPRPATLLTHLSGTTTARCHVDWDALLP